MTKSELVRRLNAIDGDDLDVEIEVRFKDDTISSFQVIRVFELEHCEALLAGLRVVILDAGHVSLAEEYSTEAA